MREGFAEELLGIEQQLADGFEQIGQTLEAIAETILGPASQDATRLVAGANILRASSREIDARLVAVSRPPGPGCRRSAAGLVLIQVAQHAA